jgi:hypothetical protein
MSRAFIFERPDELYSQFKELEMRLPSKVIPYIWSATEVFQKNLAERKARNDPRGSEEALRRATQAKLKIQESLDFIAKKKAEREAAAARGRGSQRGGPPSSRGRTMSRGRGGARRYGLTRKLFKQKQLGEALTLAEYRGGGIEPGIEEYVQSTMAHLWKTFLQKS